MLTLLISWKTLLRWRTKRFCRQENKWPLDGFQCIHRKPVLDSGATNVIQFLSPNFCFHSLWRLEIGAILTCCTCHMEIDQIWLCVTDSHTNIWKRDKESTFFAFASECIGFFSTHVYFWKNMSRGQLINFGLQIWRHFNKSVS